MGRKKNKDKKTHHTTKQHQFATELKGKLDITRSGIGYVIIADGSGDVLVKPGNFNTALHGDEVRVKIIKENISSGRKEGKITGIIERKQTQFVGTIQLSANFAFFIPDNNKHMPDLFIPLTKLQGAKNKEKVVAKITGWNKDNKNPEGEVIALLNAENESDAAMKNILVEANFPLQFEKDTLHETAELSEVLDEKEIIKRKDYRNILTFTIDPATAKDFDDAVSVRLIKNGIYEIGVHIADVSHYVQPATALDLEAYQRATSVYLPDRVNPMLPEKISNELCSLCPNEDRFTFSIIFQINTKGTVKQYWLGKTVIHSNHRFNYDEVQQIIEEKKGLYKDEILLLNNIAQHLRKQRFKKGAINFSSQDVRFKLDEHGKPIGIEINESNESHELIEELMLLANKTVAENISKIKVNRQPIPFPYRIHDQPDEEKLLPFIAFAKKYGHKFNTSSPEKIALSFNKMLQDVEGKPEQHVLEQLGIRTMAKAVYSTENIGHYGLGFENYCHFTSPIRRYPDVMVHRVLESVLNHHPIIDKKMEEKCKHCSERERAAMDCERASNKYKQVEFMKDRLGEDFEGIISGVASFGFWVETIETKCEGLVSVVSLSDYDEFRLVENDYSLAGKRSGRKFKMGDKITIKVVAANLDKRQLDYEWIMDNSNEKTVRLKKKKKK